jgi:hypothetical protein
MTLSFDIDEIDPADIDDIDIIIELINEVKVLQKENDELKRYIKFMEGKERSRMISSMFGI